MKKKKWLMLLLLLFVAICARPSQAKASNVTPTPIPVTLSWISATYEGGSVKVGEQISKDDIRVKAWYTDGSSEDITEFVLTSNRVLVEGNNTFVVISSGKAATFTVFGKKATSIVASYDYFAGPVSVGNRVGRENITVTMYFNDYSSETVEDYVLINAVINTVGTQKVTVAYNGLTADFYVPTVEMKNIVALNVEYTKEDGVKEGSSISESHIVVIAVYSDNSVEKIYNYTVLPAKVTELGPNTIEVYYRGQRGTFTVDCVAKELKRIEAVYNGGSVEVGEYVDPEDIVVTAVYDDDSSEVLKEFELLNARIQVIGRNYVTVRFENMRVDIEVQGIAKTSLSYNHAASFYVKNEGKTQMRIQIPLPKKLGTSAVTGRSLKASSVSNIMRKLRAQDAEYIAFEVKPTDEVMDDIFPLLMKVTLPSTYDIEYTSVYFTINRKSVVGRMNVDILGAKEMEMTIYQPGTYIICYQKPEEELEEDTEDDYLD